MSFQAAIIPQPSELRYSGGELRLKSPISVYFPQNNPEIVKIVGVCCKIQQLIGGPLLQPTESNIANKNNPGIFLAIESDGSNIDGSYRLLIEEDGVRISAPLGSGLFCGMQSLMQLFSTAAADDNEFILPGLEINDSPRFAWRGMHLDVSRHFFPVEFIKKWIDLLAFHKMNMFHWHLTDDQGWRIEIERYPRLTEIGAWRTESNGQKYGGFYTHNEIRDIVQYAQARFVTIVPEIELPGHNRLGGAGRVSGAFLYRRAF